MSISRIRLEDAEPLGHPRPVGQGVDLSFYETRRRDRGCDRFATKRRRSHPALRNEHVLAKSKVQSNLKQKVRTDLYMIKIYV